MDFHGFYMDFTWVLVDWMWILKALHHLRRGGTKASPQSNAHGFFCLRAEVSLHTDAFTHRPVYAGTALHTDAFTHRPFDTQTLAHTDAVRHRRFFRTDTF